MRIAEISSQEFQHSSQQLSSPSHDQLLSQIESAVKQVENLNLSPNETFPNTISGELRRYLNQLSQLTPLSNSLKLLLWKLSYRLWNACVDFSNAASIRCRSRSPDPTEELAKLRHVAADFLFLTGEVSGVPSPAIKSASFYHKTGLIWYELRNFDLASTCFEKATDIVSNADINSIKDGGERKFLLDLSIARARTAWEISDYKLAVALLNRAKSLLFGLTEHHKMLGNQYLAFGKSLLSKKMEDSALDDPFRLMNEALDLYEKGLRAAKIREEMIELKELKLKTLRFISAVHLQMGEFESVIKCVKVLREGSGDNQHPSLPVLAMKAWLGLKRYGEAEKELRGMVVNKGVPEGVWVSAVEAYFQAAGTAGAETTKGVFLGLLGRCSVSASAAVRVAHKVIGDGDDGSRERAKVVAELVSDERVVALFAGDAAARQRMTMHALLWNW